MIREFIDDEAELSDQGEFSDDEVVSSDDDKIDTELIDLDAKELDTDEEEDVRRLYQKQLADEDKRSLLLMQEKLDETGQRRRKFKWRNKEFMEISLRRHCKPGQGTDDEDDTDASDVDFSDFTPRLKMPTVKSGYEDDDNSFDDEPVAGPSTAMSDDSNSNLISRPLIHAPTRTVSGKNVDLKKFLYRDKELVEALSTRETIIATREEKERTIQKEIKRLQTKTIFDKLYS